jgi:hypothetical protein
MVVSRAIHSCFEGSKCPVIQPNLVKSASIYYSSNFLQIHIFEARTNSYAKNPIVTTVAISLRTELTRGVSPYLKMARVEKRMNISLGE